MKSTKESLFLPQLSPLANANSVEYLHTYDEVAFIIYICHPPLLQLET